MSADRGNGLAATRGCFAADAAACRCWKGWLCVASIVVTGAMTSGCGGGNAEGPAAAVAASSISPEQVAAEQLGASGKENPHFDSGSLTTVALDEVRVAAHGSGWTGPDIARLVGGGLAVAWNAYRSGGGSDNGIFVQRYDGLGRMLGSPAQVAAMNYPPGHPSVTGLADGGYALSWTVGMLWTRAFDADGQPRGEQYQVNPLDIGALEHSIAGLSAGGYVVAWRGYPPSDGSWGNEIIYTRRFDAAGSPVGGATRASTSTLGTIGGASVAALPDGGYVVVWSSSTTNWSSTNIYARRFDAAGAALGGETLVSAGPEGYWTRVAALPAGGWIVAWARAAAGAPAGIYLRRYDSDGVPIGAEIVVKTGTAEPPLLAALSDGGYVVGWVVYERKDFYADGQRYDLWVGDLHARRYDGTGAPEGGELVFPTASNERDAAMAGLAQGGFALAWRADADPRYPGDIYVRSFKDALVGAAGSDWLQAGDRIHVLLGAAGKDRLLGSASHDWLDGGTGDDFMTGGSGDDTYIVDSDKDIVLERPGEGRDTVRSSISYALPHDVEDLVLTGADPIDGWGNKEDNVIVGNAAANRLSGGPGNDTLEGGGGGDTFVFDSRLGADNVDLVKNFVAAEDTIELDARIFKALPSGVASPAALIIGSAATERSHRIVFDPVTKALLYDADGSGSEAAVQLAVLEGLVGNLSAANFVVR